ncbi:histidinolphosphatase [Geranomyces michiganensis]|nr:histidinolphosphatase [Geranomyces michiganensis]
MISLHSHSGQHCLHAKGKLEEVVIRAIELGFETYGLSEHVPRSRKQDLYPEEAQLTCTDLMRTFQQYAVEARRLQLKYAASISLLVGAETELIHSTSLDELDQLRAAVPLDYLVGSVHHVLGHPLDFDIPRYKEAEAACGGAEGLFCAYFDAQEELLRRVQPLVIGHFDLVRLFNPQHALSEDVWRRIRRNVDTILEYDGLVEINSRAWKKDLKDAYPQRDILQYMMTKGMKFTLSDDSHGPQDVGMHYDKLHSYLVEMGISTVYRPVRTLDGQITVQGVDNVWKHAFWTGTKMEGL